MDARKDPASRIEALQKIISHANLSDQMRKRLNEQLTLVITTFEDELTDPISLEYFSLDKNKIPYTIMTGGKVKTVVSEETKNQLEDKETKVDPFTTLPITGYVKDDAKLKLLADMEHKLWRLEQLVVDAQKLTNFACTEIKEGSFTLQITIPHPGGAKSLYTKMLNQWQLPVNVNEQTITIYPSQGKGTCGIYVSHDLSSDEVKTQIAISFANKQHRDEFINAMGLSNANIPSIVNPGFGPGTNVIFFDQEAIQQSLLPPPSISQSPHTKFQPAQTKEPMELPKVLLYRARKGELAVKFPDEATRNHFIVQLGGKEKFDGKDYPITYDDNKDTLFFPGYQAKNGEFASIFPSSTMCLQFFNLLIYENRRVNKTDAFMALNSKGENVIYFKDPAFFKERGNVNVTLREMPGSASPSSTMGKPQ